TPVAGEAPQRTKVEPTRSALSGRIGVRIPASPRTLTSKIESAIEARTPLAFALRSAIPARRLFALHAPNGDAGDALAAADPAHPLVPGRLDADPGRGRVGERPLHLRAVLAEAGLLANHRRIDVEDRPGDRADHCPQHVDRVGVLPGEVVIGEHRADVAAAG